MEKKNTLGGEPKGEVIPNTVAAPASYEVCTPKWATRRIALVGRTHLGAPLSWLGLLFFCLNQSYLR